MTRSCSAPGAHERERRFARTGERRSVPPGESWSLRVSVAEITRDGPFSDYAGIERWFAVLQGPGVALQLGADRWEQRLGAPPLRFDGALAPMCWLIDGATSDLNLLVRRDAGRGSMAIAHADHDWVSPIAWRALFTTLPASLVEWLGLTPSRSMTLQFADGESAATYGLTGAETYSIEGIASIEPRQDVTVKVTREGGEQFDIVARCRIDTFNELEYYRSGGILHFVLRNLAA